MFKILSKLKFIYHRSLYKLNNKKIPKNTNGSSILFDIDLDIDGNVIDKIEDKNIKFIEELEDFNLDDIYRSFTFISEFDNDLIENIADANIVILKHKTNNLMYLISSKIDKVKLHTVSKLNIDDIFLMREETANKLLVRKKTLTAKIDRSNGAIKYLTELLEMASLNKATDIYISKRDYSLSIRMRLPQGVKEIETLGIEEAQIARNTLEIMSNVEHKTSFFDSKIVINKQEYRINFITTSSGYRATIRSYASDFKSSATLSDLGYTKETQKIIEHISGNQNGMFLFTAQTGQGKTTTQNTILEQLSKKGLEVVSVEDVVEKQIHTIDQIDLQIYDTADEEFRLTQSKAVKLFLRARPDVINMGEIRDSNQVQEGYKASITGHLVFGSLHTNSVSTAIQRLRKEGNLDDESIKAVVRGVLYQQLTRKLCNHCKIKLENEYKANKNGCNLCNYGYSHMEVPINEVASFSATKDYDINKPSSWEHYISLDTDAFVKLKNGVIDRIHYEAIVNRQRKPSLEQITNE